MTSEAETRRLIPGPALTLNTEGIVEHYRAPRDRWLRASMVATVDGAAAGADGVSASVSSPADRAVFSVLRAWSDAVLVASGTVRAERYTRLPAHPRYAEERRARGQEPAPLLAVVTGSARLDYARLTSTTGGSLRVYTRRDAPGIADARSWLRDDELRLADGNWTVESIVSDLRAAGLEHILCEGGPGYLAQVAAAGVLDELCLTISPQLVGGEAIRITHGTEAASPLRLAGLLESDSTLLARYVTAP